MGVESGILQLASEHGIDYNYVKRVTDYGTRLGLKFNMILCAVLLLVGMFIPLKIEEGRTIIKSLCLLPVVQLIYNLDTCFLRSRRRNREYAAISVINTVLIFLISVIASFVLREYGLVIGYYLAYIIASLIGYLYFHVRLLSKERIEYEDKNILLKISLISMCNNGLSQLMYLLDIFVLGIIDPNETILASYKVATMIPTALTFIPLSLMTYEYPYFAEHKGNCKWIRKRYKEILVYFGMINLSISALMYIFAPTIIKLLYGEQYLDAVLVFRILSINYFFSGSFRIVSGNLLVTQRKLKFNFILAVLSSSINIVADYYFIQWWGSTGAALATLLVVIVSSVLSTGYFLHITRYTGMKEPNK